MLALARRPPPLLPSEVKLLNYVSKHRDEALISLPMALSIMYLEDLHLGLPEELITGSARSSWTAGLAGWLEQEAPVGLTLTWQQGWREGRLSP